MKECAKIFKKTLPIPIYNTSVVVYVVEHMDYMQEYLEKKKIRIDVTGCDGCVVQLGHDDKFQYNIVLQKDKLSHNLIAHEIFHLGTNMTHDIDINDDESRAWLIGYLSQEIYKILGKEEFTIQLHH